MELTVITPNQTSRFSIVWLELNTPTGNMVIQPGHAPMILILAPNQSTIFRLKSGKQESIVIRHGIADIRRNRATLVINETV